MKKILRNTYLLPHSVTKPGVILMLRSGGGGRSGGREDESCWLTGDMCLPGTPQRVSGITEAMPKRRSCRLSALYACVALPLLRTYLHDFSSTTAGADMSRVAEYVECGFRRVLQLTPTEK